jgi:hypothetical protein
MGSPISGDRPIAHDESVTIYAGRLGLLGKRGKKAVLFLKKKNQKDFYFAGLSPSHRQRPKGIKLFCGVFLKKSDRLPRAISDQSESL